MTGPDRRRQKIRDVAHQRLGWVSCAIEALYHRHNGSAVLRTCDALGVHRVHLVEGHFRPAKGAARGAERWLDLRWDARPEDTLAALRAEGRSLWIADFSDTAVPPEAIPLDRPVCLWFGAELVGVGAAARAAADGVVTLPMYGMAQSLNVSVAAALALSTVAGRARAALGARALLPPAERDATLAAWRAREDDVSAGAAARAAAEWDDPVADVQEDA